MFFLTDGETVKTVNDVVSAVDFAPLLDTYLTIAGVALPVVVGILAAKKGISWLKGFIARA